MKRALGAAALAAALLIVGCDTGVDGDVEEEFGEVEATMNGQEWRALPQAALVFTREVFSPQNDSLISMQFDDFQTPTYRRGALVATFFYRGDGDYEIERTHVARIEGDPNDPSVLDTLQANITFWDTNHQTPTARFAVAEDEPFHVTITSFDRSEGILRGTFSGTLIFEEGASSDNPVRNYPDTLQFNNGEFESTIDEVDAGEGA